MRRIARPFLLSALLLNSCVETILMDTHEDLPVVVYCVLEEKETQTLELYFAKGKSKAEYIPVTDAEVSLYCYDEKVANFHRDGSVWIVDYQPECGQMYQLKIQIPQREPISAIVKMPDNFHVFCFWAHVDEQWDGIGDFPDRMYTFSYELRVLYQSPSHPDTYGTLFAGKSNLWVFPLSQWSDAWPLREEPQYNELITTDHPYADLFNVSGITHKELPCFQEKSYSQFNKNYRNLLLWLSNDYPDLPMCRNFVHINHPAHFNNGKDISSTSCAHYSTGSFILSTNFITDFETKENPLNPFAPILPLYPGYNNYEFISVSDELDLYLRDLYIKDLNRDNLTQLYCTENIHSNIKNGIGIFGAKIRRFSRPPMIGYRDGN